MVNRMTQNQFRTLEKSQGMRHSKTFSPPNPAPPALARSKRLSSSPAAVLRNGAHEPGAQGYAPSCLPPDQLVAAIHAAANGLLIMQASDAASSFPGRAAPARQQQDEIEPLTARELQVLQMLASGLANKEIASRLSVSEHTVKFHVASILGKLGAESRTEAVAIGIRRGLVLI